MNILKKKLYFIHSYMLYSSPRYEKENYMKNDFGDRMKSYERTETNQFFDLNKPVYVRIDGRSFSKFTRQMKKPFDYDFTDIMQEVTKYLVKETSANLGYTQSDEISLLFCRKGEKSSVFFEGKKQKMVSVLSALATAKFVQLALDKFPEQCAKNLPIFDARAFNVPNLVEAMNCFLWRQKDAVRNSVSMFARYHFPHSQIQGKSKDEMISMLEQKGTSWYTLPVDVREGAYFKREVFALQPNLLRSRISKIEGEKSFLEMNFEERMEMINENL